MRTIGFPWVVASLAGCNVPEPGQVPPPSERTDVIVVTQAGLVTDPGMPPTYTLDLGTFSVGGIVVGALNVFESREDRCAIPEVFGFAGSDELGNSVEVSIPYEGPDASGPHRFDDSEIAFGLGGQGEVARFAPSMSLTVDGVSYYSQGGVLDVAFSDARDEVTAMLVDTELESLDGEALVTNGTVTLPLMVLCLALDQQGDDCGWLPEATPYASDFCVTATADYPDSIKR
jgi:hypothetical protein